MGVKADLEGFVVILDPGLGKAVALGLATLLEHLNVAGAHLILCFFFRDFREYILDFRSISDRQMAGR